MTDDPPQSTTTAGDSGESTGQEHLPERLRAAFRGLFKRGNGSARSEIEDVIAEDEASGTSFSPEERAMLRAILRLGDMRVDDVMVPRADIEAVEAAWSVWRVLLAFREAGHSRMPVYRETLDDPIGMIHIKDVMAWITDTAAAGPRPPEDEPEAVPACDLAAVDLGLGIEKAGLVRPLLFVPPSMPARLLLERMQASRTQIALVIDEYGGTDGLVSIEDLVEIIVGEIEDEYDLEEEVKVVKVADGQYVADARTSIEDAQAVIGENFRPREEDQDVETVGGLVFAATGRIPVRGEIVNAVEGYEFEILDADPRRIKRIRIRERRKLVPRVRQKVGRDPEARRRPEPPPEPPSDADAA
ncbi:hemolysin family protein [Propylenella binzhouense]|uniref:HlyC/CorC family transporter n=1 Tax=Propylenella binzhouense TaxID=2555902 RepID=A0A964T3V2_9HYPH|nr:hemolysin family protein [Propylenella binzhouense]MYZ47429.1 HlyC/CorC family transporter [Propylenella binzhouense]